MAKLRPGPLASAISGSIGGTTFASTSRGMLVRRRRPTKAAESVGQRYAQSVLARAQAAWLALSDPSREAWRSAAAQLRFPDSLGVPRIPAARAVFASVVAFESPLLTDFSDSNPNLATSATPTASTERVGFEAAKVIDGITGYTNCWVAATTYTTGSLTFVWTSPVRVHRLKWMDRPLDTNTGPANWSFQRLDGASWTTLRTVTDTTYSESTWHEYDIPSDLDSTSYRMVITANQGNANRLAISELELYSDPPTSPGALRQSPYPTVSAISAEAGADWTCTLDLPSGYDYATLRVGFQRTFKDHALAIYNRWQLLHLATYTGADHVFLDWSSVPDALASIDVGEVLGLQFSIRLVKYPEVWLPSPKAVIPTTIT